ncbi:hypothetical protein F5Y11DRAFT_215830 [Daldinia sp. FL1419]|nr:hypothetical protein F5Y11DRAFT_215830 [Daldinia sp. FL1419]
MNQDADEVRPASQATSHLPLLEPISGATLYELESKRREALRRRGRVKTGCAEVDDAVLLGGLERGSVVGLSAEEVEFGLLVGLQTVAHTLVSGAKQKATIVTTLTSAAILPTLRDVIRAQVQARLGPTANQKQDVLIAEVRSCLERISISRVFDVEGLWEVLRELEMGPEDEDGGDAVAKEEEEEEEIVPTAFEDKEDLAPTEKPESIHPKDTNENEITEDVPTQILQPKTERMEVADSEDEDELSLSPPEQSQPQLQPSTPPQPSPPNASLSSSLSPPPMTPTPEPTTAKPVSPDAKEPASHIPDLIIITHFSSLLTNLFTRSADNKSAAHTTIQLLSSHLRYLARSAEGPLVMLLNSTTSTSTSGTSALTSAGPSHIPTPPNPASGAGSGSSKDRPLEPTLRSIFSLASVRGGAGGGTPRQNKPAFGATFAQFLDLHMLCTRVPRTKADAVALAALAAGAGAGMGRWCWVVEVLLDEMGVEEGDGDSGGGDGGRKRRNREQRWGAVDVRGNVRIVDALLGG